MNIKRILPLAFASILLFNVSCSSDNDTETGGTQVNYGNGILVANEGGFTKPTSDVTFISNNLGTVYTNIYSNNNGGEAFGKVLQSIGFSGDKAYLVANIPNKIDIVNRTTFKLQTTVTENLDNPRYIAFSGNKYFVTNNNFSGKKKLNAYNISDNVYFGSIEFPRLAEKVVEAEGNIIVQTDGVGYDAAYNELPTGYTITVVNPSTMVNPTTITLPAKGIIKDLIAHNGIAYVLVADKVDSYIYEINSKAGNYTTTTLTGISNVQKLRAYNNEFYFIAKNNKIYEMPIGTIAPIMPLATAVGNVYGFDVIDGKIFASEANFSEDGKVNVYSTLDGTLLKTFTAGVGTNGFYKN
ncbi:DUF5074 domain-containing protein [Chryseobacterium jejuense]|uniref:DUF5074 domain-containing protein n=1 Tax=Chryseobacterium jejuense TaxID=445960 RepID=UPI001AE77895|nr:DUF5074 domain-containing protein [Chryseobacterium jejuense]MBP2616340.1 hypothetical protein [Chryseobacterium jejuense]